MIAKYLIACVLVFGPTAVVATAGQSSPPAGSPLPATATPARDSLRGLHALEVQVEDVGTIASQCNVHTDDVSAATSVPLRDAGLFVQDRSLTPYVYVNVHVVKVNAICVAAVRVSVRDPGLALITYQQGQTTGQTPNSAAEILLWEKETLLAGPADTFGGRVTDQVRTFVTAFLAEVTQQNSSGSTVLSHPGTPN